MRPTTEGVKAILENEQIVTSINNLMIANPTHEIQETTISEVYEGYLDIRSLLLESIEKGVFDELPFVRRNAILSNLQQIQRFLTNIAQLIPQYNSLYDQVQIIRLPRLVTKTFDSDVEIKDLTNLRRRYKRIVKDLSDSEAIKNQIDQIKDETESSFETINEIVQKGSNFNTLLSETQEELEKKIEIINDSEQDIENKKKEILAFASNVEKSDQKLIKIENELQNSIKQKIEENIDLAEGLIKEASEALELKQTEGISRAYSSRLEKLTSEKTNKYWLMGALGFVLITFIFGFLLTGGKISIFGLIIEFSGSDNIAFIVGRILLTGIGIAGAVFCANRYVNLKNLEEDYEYKVVLSKSILAFANKIKDIDKDKVAEYLTKVLSDLHQDPQRDRKANKEDKVNINSMSQLTELFTKWKEMN